MISSKIYHIATLPGLPLELILEIDDLLLPVDQTYLSLCNHQLHELPQAYHRSSLRGAEVSLLHRLERDLPG
jgi:hypothetical protein